MRIHLVALGTRMPPWVEAGFADYARRLPPQCRLVLQAVPAVKRRKGADPARALAEEGRRLLAAAPRGAHLVALEVGGRRRSTGDLARWLEGRLAAGRDCALLVGGADGLAPACRQAAAECWSLSDLTLAHPLVRVVVAEQLYRAWSILQGHPYHRA